MITPDREWLVTWSLPRQAEFKTRLDAERFAELLAQMPALRDIQIAHRRDHEANLSHHTRELRGR